MEDVDQTLTHSINAGLLGQDLTNHCLLGAWGVDVFKCLIQNKPQTMRKYLLNTYLIKVCIQNTRRTLQTQ